MRRLIAAILALVAFPALADGPGPDVSGKYVVGLRGYPIAATTPQGGQTLVFNASDARWYLGFGLPYPVVNGQCLIGSGGQAVWGSCSGAGTAVNSVTGTASQLLASPTTGAVIMSLINTAVTPGSYTNTNLTVDAQGRITAAANGSGGGGGTPGGTSGQIQYNNAGAFGGFTMGGDFTVNTGTGAGTLATVNSNVGTFASATFNAKGLATAAANLTGDVTTSGAATTLATVNANVGSFTNANITVNAKGLVTAAANGSGGSSGISGLTTGQLGIAGSATTISSSVPFGATGNSTVVQTDSGGKITASLIPNTAVSAGSYTSANITVGADGRLTAAANGSGGGTAVIFTGTTAGTANAQTVASPTPSGFTITDQYIVRIKIGAGLTNTAAATLSFGGTTATAVKAQNNSGTPVALSGGELVAGNEYDLVVNTGASAYVIRGAPPTGSTIAATSGTVTQAQWASFHQFVITTASQTITLPVVTGLSSGGGIIIQTVGFPATLTPNAADGINGGTINTSVTIPPDTTVIVSTTGTSGTTAINAPLGPAQYFPLAWAEGINLSAAARFMGRVLTERRVYGIKCNVQTAAGSAGTVKVYSTASGTAPASGTDLTNTTSCDANAASNTDQTPSGTNLTILAGYNLWAVFSGTGTAGNGGITVTYR